MCTHLADGAHIAQARLLVASFSEDYIPEWGAIWRLHQPGLDDGSISVCSKTTHGEIMQWHQT
jgi:hypothetical protein